MGAGPDRVEGGDQVTTSRQGQGRGGPAGQGAEPLLQSRARPASGRSAGHAGGHAGSSPEAGLAGPVAAARADGIADAAGGVAILLVEDNLLIRADTALTLEEMGHTVTQAAKAAPALAELERRSFDLLLTDLGLPDMDGNDLARRAVEIQQRLAVIYATGDGSLPGGHPPQTVLLCKPYGEEQLRDAIAAALARAG